MTAPIGRSGEESLCGKFVEVLQNHWREQGFTADSEPEIWSFTQEAALLVEVASEHYRSALSKAAAADGEARVDPAEIVAQRAKGWPDFHPEKYCHRCGNRNVWSWFVDSETWNVSGIGSHGIVCPTCFTIEHERVTGTQETWELRRDRGLENTEVRLRSEIHALEQLVVAVVEASGVNPAKMAAHLLSDAEGLLLVAILEERRGRSA